MNKRQRKKRRNFKDNFTRVKDLATICVKNNIAKNIFLILAKRIQRNKDINLKKYLDKIGVVK